MNHPLQAALAKRGGKTKPKPPASPGPPPVAKPKPAPLPGYRIRQGLDQPTIWGGNKSLAFALGRRR